MKATFLRFLRQDGGATAVEYGLIVAIICIAVIGSVGSMGGAVKDMYQQIVDGYNKVQP